MSLVSCFVRVSNLLPLWSSSDRFCLHYIFPSTILHCRIFRLSSRAFSPSFLCPNTWHQTRKSRSLYKNPRHIGLTDNRFYPLLPSHTALSTLTRSRLLHGVCFASSATTSYIATTSPPSQAQPRKPSALPNLHHGRQQKHRRRSPRRIYCRHGKATSYRWSARSGWSDGSAKQCSGSGQGQWTNVISVLLYRCS